MVYIDNLKKPISVRNFDAYSAARVECRDICFIKWTMMSKNNYHHYDALFNFVTHERNKA